MKTQIEALVYTLPATYAGLLKFLSAKHDHGFLCHKWYQDCHDPVTVFHTLCMLSQTYFQQEIHICPTQCICFYQAE